MTNVNGRQLEILKNLDRRISNLYLRGAYLNFVRTSIGCNVSRGI